MLLTIWMLFVPGERGAVSPAYLVLWTSLLFVGLTLVDLPDKAWGAELSDDYAERSRVTALREGLGFAGQIGLPLRLFFLASTGESAPRAHLRASDRLGKHRAAALAALSFPLPLRGEGARIAAGDGLAYGTRRGARGSRARVIRPA